MSDASNHRPFTKFLELEIYFQVNQSYEIVNKISGSARISIYKKSSSVMTSLMGNQKYGRLSIFGL